VCSQFNRPSWPASTPSSPRPTRLGHTIVNNGRTALIVKNGSAASINVTITPGGTAGGYVVTPVVVAIAAAEEGYIGSFPAYPFNTTSGLVQVDFSAVVTVTVAAISL